MQFVKNDSDVCTFLYTFSLMHAMRFFGKLITIKTITKPTHRLLSR